MRTVVMHFERGTRVVVITPRRALELSHESQVTVYEEHQAATEWLELLFQQLLDRVLGRDWLHSPENQGLEALLRILQCDLVV